MIGTSLLNFFQLNYQGKYDVKVAKEYSTTFLEDEEELRKIYFIFKECVAGTIHRSNYQFLVNFPCNK